MSATCSEDGINEPRARRLNHIQHSSLKPHRYPNPHITHTIFLGGYLIKFGYTSVTLLESAAAKIIPQGDASGRKEASLMNPQSRATFIKVCLGVICATKMQRR